MHARSASVAAQLFVIAIESILWGGCGQFNKSSLQEIVFSEILVPFFFLFRLAIVILFFVPRLLFALHFAIEISLSFGLRL